MEQYLAYIVGLFFFATLFYVMFDRSSLGKPETKRRQPTMAQDVDEK